MPPRRPRRRRQGGQEVIVTGQRLRGEVAGNVEPEVRLNEEQIRAYGASSIGELVDALAPQTRSGRGRQSGPPIVLLNGQRIGGFGEIRELPPEAIERVDILPEEVALSYGYRADQRVMNIVLKENFRAVTRPGRLRLRHRGRPIHLGAQRHHPQDQPPEPLEYRRPLSARRCAARKRARPDPVGAVRPVRPRPAMSAPRPSSRAPRSIRR